MTEILNIQLDSKLKNAFHRKCEVLQIPVDKELDRTESAHKEREAHPDAIPAGQGRSAEIRQRRET